jgi:hypothetical protein
MGVFLAAQNALNHLRGVAFRLPSEPAGATVRARSGRGSHARSALTTSSSSPRAVKPTDL